MGPNHWTAVLTNLDTAWIPVRPDVFFDTQVPFWGGPPMLLVESPDLAVMALAQQQPGYWQTNTRHEINMHLFRCDDPGRVPVRHEHLTALHNATILAEFQAARALIQADTSYPPPAPVQGA